MITVTLKNGSKAVYEDANEWQVSHAGILVIAKREPRVSKWSTMPGYVRELFLYAPGEWKTAERA